jgi:hypothetical protein
VLLSERVRMLLLLVVVVVLRVRVLQLVMLLLASLRKHHTSSQARVVDNTPHKL